MEQFIEFAGNHPLLFLALAAVSALLVQNILSTGGKLNVAPLKATEMINREDAVVLDVRPMTDFNQGHIIHAVNIPSSGLKSQIKTLEKHKEKPIIVACRSGGQSAAACRLLKKEGYENVFNLQGGMLAWQNANLPVSRKS